ncbi:Orotidine 5'-phosphate decarboxylase [Escherichia coli]|nr:Orotidine 5'-phosphate decarboxylase [Escherichia coli]
MLAVYLFRATSGAHHQEGLVMTLTASSSSRAVTNSPVVVALDYHNRDAALAFVDKIDPRDCRLKVGKEMFTLFGPQFVRELQQRDFDIFLDLKFHDIPNTAAHAVAAAADLGVWMVNVHASGGARMMAAAREALVPFGKDAPLLIAVTVLTSMEACDLADLGVTLSPADYAERLAALTQKCGLDGVVCSAQEAVRFKQVFGQEFKLVTPGIRPQGSDAGDQRRIMTPEQALAAGVDYMVIGRPVTQSVDPAQTLKAINASFTAECMMSDSNSRLVYSTETGRIDEPKAAPVRPKGDGVVRIQRQTSGRKGKGVCLITGVDLDDAELTKLAAELKKKCGCGGAVKDGIIEIQGDKRDLLKSMLEAKGMKVKLAGG